MLPEAHKSFNLKDGILSMVSQLANLLYTHTIRYTLTGWLLIYSLVKSANFPFSA